MTKIVFPKPTPAQRQILESKSRFKVVACGRRFGKTEIGKIEALKALFQGKNTWYCTPTYKLASEIFDQVRDLIEEVPGVGVNKSSLTITYRKTKLQFVSVHEPDNLRGSGLNYVILDEAAFMVETVWTKIIRPMLATSKGGGLILSSPNGRNWFWDVFNYEMKGWQSFHFTTEQGGLVDAEELEDIRSTTPERIWREEYLAEFVDDAGAVFTNVVVRATSQAEPIEGHHYYFGIDWGRDRDYTAIAVVDATWNSVATVVRFNDMAYGYQQRRIIQLAKRWNPLSILAESNSIGAPNIEAINKQGVRVKPFQMQSNTKGDLILNLALAIESEALSLINDEVLLKELKVYTMERTVNGFARYSAPQGYHDDTVIALALAWHAATKQTKAVSTPQNPFFR